MKKKNIINLIKYHAEENDSGFRTEAYEIAKEFDSAGDYQIAEYIMALMSKNLLFWKNKLQILMRYYYQIQFAKTLSESLMPLVVMSVLTNFCFKGIREPVKQKPVNNWHEY